MSLNVGLSLEVAGRTVLLACLYHCSFLEQMHKTNTTTNQPTTVAHLSKHLSRHTKLRSTSCRVMVKLKRTFTQCQSVIRGLEVYHVLDVVEQLNKKSCASTTACYQGLQLSHDGSNKTKARQNEGPQKGPNVIPGHTDS
eukprot:1157451-Pelagomonas_calceolata.AAC.4